MTDEREELKEYTRESLIKQCERALVPQSKWRNRDSGDAQRQIGEAWALLRAGCDFTVQTEENCEKDAVCITDERTIWVEIHYKGFQYSEWAEDLDMKNVYIPTQARLEERDGDDWY